MGIETTLCYIERDGAYLMLHRVSKVHDVNEGKWIGVGGKFEQGESPEDCMIREVFEETGLTPIRWRHRGIVTFISPRSVTEHMHLFTITEWTGELHSCDEGDLKWVAKDKVLELPHWKGDEIFLSLIDDDYRPFFSLELVYDERDELIDARLDGALLDIPE